MIKPATDGWAERSFSGLLGSPAELRPADLLGLEHEFVVRADERPVDFRTIIHDLPLDGRRLDPDDPNAYRCRWGGVVTADRAEAEVAIAPVRRRSGFPRTLETRAAVARSRLEAALPNDLRLEGYSTHLNISMPDGLNDTACRIFARTFAPGVMLLLDRQQSPGLIISPRPGRTELAAEYADGPPLRAAAAFAAGGAIAAATTAAGPRRSRNLPPALAVQVQAANARFGWYVDRTAFGPDLLAEGRSSVLTRASGGTISAQAHLELAWVAARTALGPSTSPADIEAVDRMVSGALPLPLEGATDGDGAPPSVVAPRSPFGQVVVARTRPGFSIEPELATWDYTLFALRGAGRTAYANVPRDRLPRFLRLLDAGELDAVLLQFLAEAPAARTFDSWHRAGIAALYDARAPVSELHRPERAPDWLARGDPQGAGTAAPGNGPVASDRSGKWPGGGPTGPPPVPPKAPVGPGLPSWLPKAAIGVGLLFLGALGFWLLGFGTPPTTSPSPSASPSITLQPVPSRTETPTPQPTSEPTLTPSPSPTATVSVSFHEDPSGDFVRCDLVSGPFLPGLPGLDIRGIEGHLVGDVAVFEILTAGDPQRTFADAKTSRHPFSGYVGVGIKSGPDLYEAFASVHDGTELDQVTHNGQPDPAAQVVVEFGADRVMLRVSGIPWGTRPVFGVRSKVIQQESDPVLCDIGGFNEQLVPTFDLGAASVELGRIEIEMVAYVREP